MIGSHLDFDTFTEEYFLCNQFIKRYNFKKHLSLNFVKIWWIKAGWSKILFYFCYFESGLGKYSYPQIVNVN